MGKIRKKLKKISAFLIALVLAAGALPVSGFLTLGVFGASNTQTLTVTYEAAYFEGHHYGGSYTITIDGEDYKAFCAQAKVSAPTKSSLTVTVTAYEITDEDVLAALYFGKDGPGEIDGVTEYGTHQAVSWYFSGQTTLSSLTSAYAQRAGIPTLMDYAEEHKDEVPDGFHAYYCYPAGSSYQAIVWWEYEPAGYLDIKKESSAPSVTASNSNYSLEGARYAVYTDKSCKTAAYDTSGNKAVFTLDSSGEATAIALSAGTYYVKETKAAAGYALDESIYTVSVESEKTTYVNGKTVSDDPVFAQAEILLLKKAAEGIKKSIAGAVYEVCFYEGNSSSSPLRTWYLETDEDGYIALSEDYLAAEYSSDDFYYSEGRAVLPLGFISIKEVKAPDGYVLSDETFTASVELNSSSGEAVLIWDDETSSGLTAEISKDGYVIQYEEVQRSELELLKTDESGAALKFIPFLLTRTWADEDGNEYSESQIIVTDENGSFSSAARDKTGENTNVLDPDEYAAGIEFKGSDEDLAAAASYNVWFGDEEEIDGSSGSLLYGEYTLTELSCSQNEGRSLISRSFCVSSSESETISISAVNYAVKTETLALNPETGTKTIPASESVSVQDTVSLSGLDPDCTYRLYVDFAGEDGKSIGSAWSESFCAQSGTDSAEITVKAVINTSAFTEGGIVTALAWLYQEINGSLYEVARHTDMGDEDEQLMVVYIKTKAADTLTQCSAGVLSKSAAVSDTVTYENLSAGVKYRLYAELADEQGNIYAQSSRDFYVYEDTLENNLLDLNTQNGQIVMPDLEFDSSKVSGKTLYVNETLYQVAEDENGNEKEILLAFHDSASLKDEDQAVSYMALSTKAADGYTNDDIGSVKEEILIADTLNFENLIAGEVYTVKAYLADQDESSGGEIVYLKDSSGGDISQVLTFTAAAGDEYFTADESASEGSSISGSTSIEFSFECDDISGKNITVITEIYHGDILISTHGYAADDDGNISFDPEESISYPAGHTTAADADTLTHIAESKAETVITDLVYFENLIAGKEYTITGSLHYARDFTDESGEEHLEGEALTITDEEGNEQEITSQVTFTAAEDMEGGQGITAAETADSRQVISGYITLEFSVDTSLLSGAVIVVFEDFTYEGVSVFTHADTSDADQCVNIPRISTQAYADGELKEICAGTYYEETDTYKWDTVTITDTVSYENLWTKDADTYALYGYLVYESTGEEILNSNGEKISAYTVFSPDEPSGQAQVIFTLDLNDFLSEDGRCFLEGEGIVVYEELYLINEEDSPEGDDAADENENQAGDDAADEDEESDEDENPAGNDSAAGDDVQSNEGDDQNSEKGKDDDAAAQILENGVLVAVHKDINDMAQAVFVSEHLTVNEPETGQDANVFYWILAGGLSLLILLCSAAFIICTNRRKGG